jgi:hypothetical protein
VKTVEREERGERERGREQNHYCPSLLPLFALSALRGYHRN